MKIKDIIVKIKDILENIWFFWVAINIKWPKAIVEFCVFFPTLLWACYCLSDKNLLHESIIFIIVYYGLIWFIFRMGITIATMGGAYTFFELLQPLYLSASGFILGVIIISINPKYEIGYKTEKQEIMAQDCPTAEWRLSIYFNERNSIVRAETSPYTAVIFGNTQQAEATAKKVIKTYFEIKTNYTYTSHRMDLVKMPKDHVEKNRYHPSYYNFKP